MVGVATKRSLCNVVEADAFEDGASASSLSEHGDCTGQRKRRRGLIEKRRRDRINCCLNDLRQMVPQAGDKQATTKLEKAEILQMTVDYIRSLHERDNAESTATSVGSAVAHECRSAGFRECVGETMRYFASFEGLDAQHPLAVRLFSHLHEYVEKLDSLARDSRQVSFRCVGVMPSLMSSASSSMAAVASAAADSYHTIHPVSPPALVSYAADGCAWRSTADVKSSHGQRQQPPAPGAAAAAAAAAALHAAFSPLSFGNSIQHRTFSSQTSWI